VAGMICTVVKPSLTKIAFWAAAALVSLFLIGALAISGAYLYVQPSLPSVEAMRQIDLQVPLRIYARNGQMIAQIGTQRRIPVNYEEIPALVRQAFIAAEDDRFFEHSGFDYQGIARSALVNLIPGSRLQGASTITMQTARNLFLTQERTWQRKIQEIFLTYRIEHEFSKQEIFGLYLNIISFGKRSYGIAAAADLYFGKTLDTLTLAEAATLARVPQAPERYNPISNPEASQQRRRYVLRRMRELRFIDTATAQAAAAESLQAKIHTPSFEVDAPYVAEMARLELIRRFGAAAQNEGYRIYTTIDTRLQASAIRAVRLGLLEYDRRHGWRGAQTRIKINGYENEALLNSLVDAFPAIGMLTPAVVLQVKLRTARIYVRGLGLRNIEWAGMSWARRKSGDRTGPSPKIAAEILTHGDIVYVIAADNAVQLVQIPESQAALVALSPEDGGIAALVGGFDYFDTKNSGKFNRATQARRQPGSGFKPFLYSAALENNFTLSSIIMDAPFVIDDPLLEDVWRPENSSREFNGPTRLREALVYSRNLVSIRILQSIGLRPVIDYAARFGFDQATLPRNLTLALGTMVATPLQVAAGYAVFANGGYRIQPYFIDRIVDPQGKVVFESLPRRVAPVCDAPPPPLPALSAESIPTQPDTLSATESANTLGETAEEVPKEKIPARDCTLPQNRIAPRAISAQNAWLMNNVLAEVITRGTGRRALALGRSDLAGKTGTTNDAKDTWFNGFNQLLVATVWVGFDQERSLGESEEGSRTAVPIWVDFMREALRSVPQKIRSMPEGLIQIRISPITGIIASTDDVNGIFETFMSEHLPTGGIIGGEDAINPITGQPYGKNPVALESNSALDAIF